MMKMLIRFCDTEKLIKEKHKKLCLKGENQFEITDFIMKMRSEM